MAATIPNCISYDPTFAYEVAVIIQDGLRRMVQEQQDVFYYLTLMNENYTHPELPKGAEEGIIKGLYQFRKSKAKGPRVQLMGSGVILREVIAAADLLEQDWGVSADIWSATSFNELRREGLDVHRWNMLHPDKPQKESHVEKSLKKAEGPVIASTDYMKSFADQIRAFVPQRFVTLGTDGFGRSDSREALRRHFEVDRHYVVLAALKALADDGKLPAAKAVEAIKKYGIDIDKPNPLIA
jgi:pyruvate dehydrogenase E1 component